MTDWVAWFRYQLQASADGFVWAFSQISPVLRENLVLLQKIICLVISASLI